MKQLILIQKLLLLFIYIHFEGNIQLGFSLLFKSRCGLSSIKIVGQSTNEINIILSAYKTHFKRLNLAMIIQEHIVY